MDTHKRDLNAVFNRRALLIGAVGVGAVGAIGTRLVFLQAQNALGGQQYTRAAVENQFDTRPIVPQRGVIYDRFGTALAITSPDYRVSITPEIAGKRVEEIVNLVGTLIGLTPEQVSRRMRDISNARKFDDVLIRQGLTWEQYAAVSVRLPELPGVFAEVGQQRFYPFTAAFAHPIGYVQKASQREVERVIEEDRASAGVPKGQPFESANARYLRHPDVRVGKAGIEANMERALRGDPGVQQVEVNAFGRESGSNTVIAKEAEHGAPVITTLDAEAQRIAMERMSGESAACVVMDIWEGDLIVMASAPGFDPNQFVNGIPAAPFKVLNEDPYKPLFHKCVTGAYKPGSTFKIVTGLAALKEGLPTNFRVNCPGYFAFGGRRFHCWKRGGHGSVDIHAAMKGSCNVFFYNAALRAGPVKIAEVARFLGLGEKFDINVPAVVEGIIPDPDWWRAKRGGEWPPGMTLNTGIGQGDIVTSPLQLAVMMSRLANGGKRVVPRLVREAPGVAPPAVPEQLPLTAEARDVIVSGIYGVCNEPGGTALTAGKLDLVRDPTNGKIIDAVGAPAGAAPVQMAGKTGTAQVRVITTGERAGGVKRNEDLPWHMRDHALFVCYAPFDQPRYACVVVVEHGGGGSRVAAPIARDVMRAVLLSDPANRKAYTVADAQAEQGGAPA
jgi:penicillin-binding protein 2